MNLDFSKLGLMGSYKNGTYSIFRPSRFLFTYSMTSGLKGHVILLNNCSHNNHKAKRQLILLFTRMSSMFYT